MSKRKCQIEETALVVQPPKKKSRMHKVRFILHSVIWFRDITYVEFDLWFVAINTVPDGGGRY